MKRLRDRRKLTPSQRHSDRRRAVKALGRPLAASSPIHHHSLTQLVICQDVSYHWLLHAREAIAAAGGNPNLDDICSRCKRPIRLTRMIRGRCKPCDRIWQRELAASLKETAELNAKARASNLLTIGRSIRRMFRNGDHYPYDLSVAYPELAKQDIDKAKEIHARHLRPARRSRCCSI